MKSDSITLRYHLKPGEEKKIRDITVSAGVFYPDEIDIAEELAEESIRSGPDASGYYYVLAECKGEIAGYTCFGPIPCTKRSYDLYWIAINGSCRRSGIGKLLMSATEEKVAVLGGKKIYVETSSKEPYYPARQFYAGCGYRQEAIIKDFYDAGDDKLIYVKDI